MCSRSVCVCVCACVCASVSLSFRAFEAVDMETIFLVCWYFLTKSRSILSIKVMYWKMLILLPGHHLNLVSCVRSRS